MNLVDQFVYLINYFFGFQVRIFYRKCNRGKVICNCVVAVRFGDDVIVIDRCGVSFVISKYKVLKMILYFNGQLIKGIRVIVYGGGKKYEVWRFYINR